MDSTPLTCYCSECPQDSCTTALHKDSTCFRSVEKELVNNTYEQISRYGCLSGADDSFATLQCRVNTLTHTEPRYIACCNNENYCNVDLPGPNIFDDPRWNMTAPPPTFENNQPSTYTQSDLFIVVGVTILLTFLTVSLFLALYKLTTTLFNKYWTKKQGAASVGSVCSFKVDYDEHLKDHYLNQAQHVHHQFNYSSTSTRTYSISDYVSQKPDSPQDNICIENTSTLPDMTSGVGTRVLEQRTMAKVVDSGPTILVGSGRFGRVFKGTYHGEDVAVKAFEPRDDLARIREERILKLLNHENIVRFIAAETYCLFGQKTETWMFLEFCPYGSLCDYLDHNEIYGPQQAIKILYSIINGLNYLHEDYSLTGNQYKQPVAHRDIKTRNILMRTPETCCLADFGHAVVKIGDNKIDFGERLQVGTVRYMAPELLKPTSILDVTQFHTFAQADLYQFGLVLWEVCHRTALDVLHPAGDHLLPYDGVVPQNPSIQDMVQIVCEDSYRPPKTAHWDMHPVMKRLAAIMVECWRPNPLARMETLGVKKKLKEMYEQVMPPQMFYQINNLADNFSMSPGSYRLDKDKTRSTDFTQ